MIKANEDLRKNWKQKIAEVVNKKMAELKKEVGEYADKQEKGVQKEEKNKSDFCLGLSKADFITNILLVFILIQEAFFVLCANLISKMDQLLTALIEQHRQSFWFS